MLGGLTDCETNLLSHRRASVVFEIADSKALERVFFWPTHRNRGRTGILIVHSLHDFEQHLQIGNGSRHWTDHAHKRERTARWREMSGRGDAARSGLEPTDSSKVGGNSNRAAAVAPNTARGHSGSNRRRFSAARS